MEAPTKPAANHIGRKISRIRELRGIKQETLASEMGVSQQTVSRLEQSETIEDEVLLKVAGVLGVYIMEMLTTLFRAKLTTGLADFWVAANAIKACTKIVI